MAVPDNVLERAQRGDRSACAALLAEAYPSAVRMARALTGNAGEADRVVDFVLTRGAKLLPAWRRGTMTQNWFYHHTLLAARERTAARRGPGPLEDLLVAEATDAGPDYVAFVRALRSLPGQQCEAFILSQGEKLNPRFLGVTMDCSSAAAENHLNAATATLTAIAGNSLGSFRATLSQAYARLGPPAESVATAVEAYARSYTRPLRLRRLVKRVILLVTLLVLAWAAWHWRQEICNSLGPWMNRLRGQLGGRG
jgi:DNA-directed RNA polymerase specialized sigma24 family protein